jgi:glycosyltransferase involved in cell wall biosynthesis
MIVFFPAGTRDERPSSHLRVYEMHEELEARGFRCLVVDPYCREDVKRCFLDEAPDGSVLYVQKMDQKQLRPAHLDEHLGRCTIVYDVDDHDVSEEHRRMVGMADAVVAGSTFVLEDARLRNGNCRLIHSMTDTEVYAFVDRSRKRPDAPVRLIWAEHWANDYFDDFAEVAPALRRLHERHGVELLVQGLRADGHPDLENRPALRGMVDRFLREAPFAEIDHVMPVEEYIRSGVPRLQACDIGIVPFKADRVGKAAQNLRSYMSVGLACVASVGNDHDHVIEDGATGFLARRAGDYAEAWFGLLEALVLDREKRLAAGELASRSVQSRFGRKVTVDKVAALLESLGERSEEVT